MARMIYILILGLYTFVNAIWGLYTFVSALSFVN